MNKRIKKKKGKQEYGLWQPVLRKDFTGQRQEQKRLKEIKEISIENAMKAIRSRYDGNIPTFNFDSL